MSDEEWDEENHDGGSSFLSAAMATIAWYAIPVGLYLLWTRLLDSHPRVGCVDATGAPCPSPRADAWQTLVDNLPRLAVALVLSTLVAVLIRWLTNGWRALTIGFAGAVVGAGTATVLFSLMANNAGN